jgi:hypothetical protein
MWLFMDSQLDNNIINIFKEMPHNYAQQSVARFAPWRSLGLALIPPAAARIWGYFERALLAGRSANTLRVFRLRLDVARHFRSYHGRYYFLSGFM